MKFKIGDLVRPNKEHSNIKKHTARQCKIGIIVSYDSFDGSLLYKIHWWPYSNYFYFPSESLELVSRVKMNDKLILKDLSKEKN
jgi:hypothetical protein